MSVGTLCQRFAVASPHQSQKLFQSVQFSRSHVQLFVTPWTAAHQASLSITNSQRLLKLKSIESVMSSNHLILYHPLLLLPSIFPSIRAFSNESVLHIRQSKYWSFSFGISPSNKQSGLISFRIDWLDLLAVQGILQSLFQHCDSKASILQCSAFFMDQLSHPYMTTGKTIALTTWTFVGKVMSLSSFVIDFFSKEQAFFSFMLQSFFIKTSQTEFLKQIILMPGYQASNKTFEKQIPGDSNCSQG